MRRVSRLLLTLLQNCEGGVSIIFDEQPFHSLPAQCGTSMTMCFGHKVQQVTEYLVTNFVFKVLTLFTAMLYSYISISSMLHRYRCYIDTDIVFY